jgi:protein-S-isoprenylcysteine O-methyltransferase Ste14
MAMVQLWRLDDHWKWILDGVIVSGFALCWWARLYLGQLWSANVTFKEGHHVVETGPYRFVRHPIYTGIIIAAFATAGLEGTLVAMVGAVIMLLGWYFKARTEEGLLRQELGAEPYDDYAGRVAMLIPFVKF